MIIFHEKEIAVQILEHVHSGVQNLAKTEAFLIAALVENIRRGSGCAQGYGNWAHVGGADNNTTLTESDVESASNFLRHTG